MTPVRPYYAEKSLSAAFYDTVAAADARLAGDLDVYAGLAPEGGQVLELGVGTGRLAFALAERGFKVVGVDNAPAMLAQAAARQADAHPAIARRVELVRGDMTGIDLKQAFDLVICPAFALAHLPRGMAWKNTFDTAARHLKSGGVAAFHLPLLDAMRDPGPGDPTTGDPGRPVLDQPTPSGARLRLFERERSFREDVGRLDQLFEYVELDGRGEVLRQALEQLTTYWTDPAQLAAPSGLTVEREPIALRGGEIHLFLKA